MASRDASNKASASNGKADKAVASAIKSAGPATGKQSIGATALNESAISGLMTIQKPHDSALKDQIAVSVDLSAPCLALLSILDNL